MDSKDKLLEVKGLKVHFPIKKGFFARTTGFVKAVEDVSFSLTRGETLGIVGESGSGKSTTARAILGLQKPTAGEILWEGEPLLKLSARDRARKIQVVFQDPLASLNPRQTIGEILGGTRLSRAARAELLTRVNLPTNALDRYPHEFSGGQRQRICIARALAYEPELLICDEAVSALDLSIRAQVLDLLSALQAKFHLSLLFITHDLGVVQHIADRVLVMYRGRVVEEGSCADVLAHPKEKYTQTLIASVPKI